MIVFIHAEHDTFGNHRLVMLCQYKDPHQTWHEFCSTLLTNLVWPNQNLTLMIHSPHHMLFNFTSLFTLGARHFFSMSTSQLCLILPACFLIDVTELKHQNVQFSLLSSCAILHCKITPCTASKKQMGCKGQELKVSWRCIHCIAAKRACNLEFPFHSIHFLPMKDICKSMLSSAKIPYMLLIQNTMYSSLSRKWL